MRVFLKKLTRMNGETFTAGGKLAKVAFVRVIFAGFLGNYSICCIDVNQKC